MSQNTHGIQALLEAERSAAEIVQDARNYRTKVLRDARDEAKRLIEERRQKADSDYKAYASQKDTGSKSAETAADQDVQQRVSKMEGAVAKHKDAIIQDLVKTVLTTG